MKNSIKVYLMAFVVILLSVATFAQRGHDEKTPEDRAAKMTERMTESLDLNAAQSEKVKTIHLKYAERMKAMRTQDKEADRSQKREAMQKMRMDIDAELKTVLTEVQYQKFQEMPKRGGGKRGGGHGFHGKKGKMHGKEMKAQYKEKIHPILLEQRAKLEAKISAEDKTTIAQLRSEIKEEKAKHQAKRKEWKKNAKDGERPSREEMKKHKEERKNSPSHLKLIELSEKYNADIEPLFAEVEPKIKALKEEWKKEREANREKKADGVEGKKRGDGKKGHKHHDKEKHGQKKNIRFLLLDPNTKEDQSALNPKSAISKVKVYPNPSQGISQIEYDLETSGMVTIELHDKSGNLIDTIERANKSAGSHKTSINFEKYTVGIYFVVLKDAQGRVISEKVIR